MFLRKSELSKRSLDQSVISVATIELENLVIYMNAVAEALWGYRSHEVLGQNVGILVPKMHQSNHDNYVNRNRETGVNRLNGVPIKLPIHTKNGEVCWVINYFGLGLSL